MPLGSWLLEPPLFCKRLGRGLFECLLLGLWYIWDQGIMEAINRSTAYEIFYTPFEILSRHLLYYIPPENVLQGIS